MTDAVVVGSLLVSLLRHADRVHIACLAQLVNVIAPIRTEPGGAAWRQSIFYPFAATARHARGDVLAAAVDSPVHRTERFGNVATLDAVATLDDATGDVTAILVNRSAVHALDVEIVLRGLPGVEVRERLQVRDDDPDAKNSASAPDRVCPAAGDPVRRTDDGGITLSVAPASWTMLRLRRAAGRERALPWRPERRGAGTRRSASPSASRTRSSPRRCPASGVSTSTS